jgi:hypothetical protein
VTILGLINISGNEVIVCMTISPRSILLKKESSVSESDVALETSIPNTLLILKESIKQAHDRKKKDGIIL